MARRPSQNKKTRVEILREKRERERERRRRIREDPVRKEEQKEKERQKYLKQKKNKVKKSIKELTPREQRQVRKKWKENSKNYRLRKSNQVSDIARLRENTPPDSWEEESDHEYIENRRKEVRRILANRNKVRRYRENKKREKIMQQLKTKTDRYKKKYYRLLQKTNENKTLESPAQISTPLTKVNELLDNTVEVSKVDTVKKSLLFGEVIKKQLVESYSELKSDKDKQIFKKVLNGKIISKYKLKTQLSKIVKYRPTPNLISSNIGKFDRKCSKRKKGLIEIKKRIELFLESDDNSRMCPGKKDFVTKNKITKQKRFLSNTLRNLFNEFLRLHPQNKISYPFFCRARPFWIKQMRVADRETCKCIIHSNMELIIGSIFKNDVLFGKVPMDIVKDICCNYKNEDCLFRQCNVCSNAIPHFKNYDPNRPLQYFQWVSLKHNYFDKKTSQTKTVQKVAKQPYHCKTSALVDILHKKLPIFLAHEARIIHQYNSISELKSALTATDILIHCDFSENYCLKYAEEVQSFHFGGARQQVTLHTTVVYMKGEMEIAPRSFCTLSEVLDHGPPAIWAHLNPILTEYCRHGVDTLHFLSDSPVTQYRNKKMFAFLGNELFKYYPQIKFATWNYHEAGHGKGAPDGIGGTCKRSADRVVTQGRDISTFDEFVHVLKECCPGITFYTICSEDIDRFSNIINKSYILPFKGTLKVHQVVTGKSKIFLRSLSCFNCKDFCRHYELGSLSYKQPSLSSESDSSPPKICEDILSKENKVKYSQVYSDSDEENPSVSNEIKIKTGTYVLVSLQSVQKQRVRYRYVAVCQSDFEEDEVKVAFLKICDLEKGDKFKVGNENDVSYIKKQQIIEVLPEPKLVLYGRRCYYKFPRRVDVLEST